MADSDDGLLSKKEASTSNITIDWRDTPTILTDSVVGYVTVGGIARVTLGQITYRGAGNEPRYLPAVTLAVPVEALAFLAAQLQEISGQAEGSHAGPENDDQEA